MTAAFCEVIGDPIAHSLSPVIHRAAYRELGLDWEYRACQVGVGQLEEYLRQVKEHTTGQVTARSEGGAWQGSSVTMPLKVEAARVADYQDGLVKLTGVANTLVPTPVGLAAFNTDVRGIVDALRETGQDLAGRELLILGAGATASSALAAGQELGVSRISVVSRRIGGPYSAQAAAARMGLTVDSYTWQMTKVLPAVFARATLVISTLPAPVQAEITLPPLAAEVVALEVPYAPWPTSFAARWLDKGVLVVPGWKMLLHQAVAQVKLFTSSEVPARSLEPALKSALPN